MISLTLENLRIKLIMLLPILTCFDSYCIFYVGSFPVTLSFVDIFLVLFLSFFVRKTIDQFTTVLWLIILILISWIFFEVNITSALLYIFYFLAFGLSKHSMDRIQINKSLKSFLFFINIFNIVALLQMLSNFTSLPRIDFIVETHMVEGFNRTNLIYLGNFVFYRSNAFYLEPSTLSQYCVLGIISSCYLYRDGIFSKKKLAFNFLLNIMALITSVSGTGILMLIISFFVYILKSKKNKNKLYIIIVVLLFFSFLILVSWSTIRNYIFQRVIEIFNPTLSGGMRFLFPYIMCFKSFAKWKIGIGPGNEVQAIIEFVPEMLKLQSTIASGYAKIFIELGVIGLVILVCCIKKCRHYEYYYIYLYIILLNFMGGNLLQTCFWAFMIFMNYTSKIYLLEGEKINERYNISRR